MSGDRGTRTYNRRPADGRAAPHPPRPPDPPSNEVADIARYIADMTTEMSRLAGAAKLELLAYFLSMARVESEMIARRARRDGGADRA